MLETIILGMILEKDLTGYDIKKIIEKTIGIFYKASFGSLYPALKKLTEKEYLTSYEKPIGNRQKIFYHITENGIKFFHEWLTSPMNVLDGSNVHLAKVYFFDKLPEKIREQQLKEYEIKNINYLLKLRNIERNTKKSGDIQNNYYQLSTLYYGILITQETIQWCRHIRAEKPIELLITEKTEINL